MEQTQQSGSINHLEDLTCIIDRTTECLQSLSEGKNGTFVVYRDERYATIDTTAMLDSGLSYKAIGLHYYMQAQMSRKSIGKKDLISAHTDQCSSVTSGMQELLRRKYLYRVRISTSRATMAGVIYISCAVPTLLDESKLQKALNKKYRAMIEAKETSNMDCDLYNNLWDKVRQKTRHKSAQNEPTFDIKNVPTVMNYKISKKTKKRNKNNLVCETVRDEYIPQTPKNPSFSGKTEQNQQTMRKSHHGDPKTCLLTKYNDQIQPLPNHGFTNNFPSIDFACAKPIEKKLSGQSKDDCQTTVLKSVFDRKFLDPVFETWNNQTKLPTHRIDPRTKLYTRTRLHIKKCLLGKGYSSRHTLDSILEAITNYGWVTTQPYSRLDSKNRPIIVRLDEFFSFSEFSKDCLRNEKHVLHGAKSWFEECLKGRTYLLEKYSARKKDKHPKLTDLLKNMLLKSGVLGFSEEKRLSPLDTNTLIGVSDRLLTFIKTYEARLSRRDIYVKTIQNMIHLLEEDKQRKLIHVGFMTGEVFWRRLEQLLLERGIMRSR